MKSNIYADGLHRRDANFAPLSPISFLQRSADVRPDHPALVHGVRILTWSEVALRCRKFAGALAGRGIGKGDTVSTMLPNVPAMYEAFFAVPMSGAVLNALNTRLDPDMIAFTLRHCDAPLLLVEPEYAGLVTKALSQLETPPDLIVVEDDTHPLAHQLDGIEYETFLAAGDPGATPGMPADEWDPIALNYTSGTTGDPKGVVYTHRGAYLNAVGNIVTWGMGAAPVYLWTLPMFHASGWCFPWTIAAMSGTNICLRRIDPAHIFEMIETHRVSHFCAAPIVHAMLIEEDRQTPHRLDHEVRALIAGAAPPSHVIENMERIGIRLTHVYGLTETYEPCTFAPEKPEWRELPPSERAALVARQGVRAHLQEGLAVIDATSKAPVPSDGETLGEVMLKGNIMMAGYLRNPASTEAAFADGWLHTGDLAVRHPDGWIEVRDRAKDIIISGGENIASVEVEEALYTHPAVMFAAVVAMKDDHWGETPCAFVELRPGQSVSEAELIAHCRERLAGYKRPRKIVFGPLPKTSTGKIQKFILRTQAANLADAERAKTTQA